MIMGMTALVPIAAPMTLEERGLHLRRARDHRSHPLPQQWGHKTPGSQEPRLKDTLAHTTRSRTTETAQPLHQPAAPSGHHLPTSAISESWLHLIRGELGKAVCEKHRLRVNRTDCLFDCLSGFSSDDLLGVFLIKGHLSFWRSSAGPDDHGDVSIRGRCGEVAAYPIDVIICIHHGSMGCSH